MAHGSSYSVREQLWRAKADAVFDHLVKLKIELVKYQSNHGMVGQELMRGGSGFGGAFAVHYEFIDV